MTNEQNNKRIAKNTLMLYFRMILTMLVSLYTSRVVLNVLGVEDYGTYNVVGGVVAMFGFFNSAMSVATQRFFSYEIGRNDLNQLGKTFNVALLVHVSIAFLICILAETIGLWFLNNYLNIPSDRMEAARWVYQFSILAFMVSVIQVPFNAIIISHERMNIYAYFSILEVILKLFIVFMLTWITFDKLKLYGILVFAVAILIALLYQQYTRHQFKETKFQLVKDKTLYKRMVSFSGWSLLGNGALVGSNQGVSMILNIFIGVTVNAAAGIASQVNTAVYGFISNFQTAFNPQIVKSYAANEIEEHKNLIYKSSKYSFFLLLILVLPILFYTEFILKLWLKIVPDYAVAFTQIILINSLIDALAGPLWMSVNAIGNIKRYQTGVSLLLLLNLPLSYIVLKLGYSPVSVFVIKAIINFLVYVFRMFYVKAYIHFSFSELVRKVFKSIFLVGSICFLLAYCAREFIFVSISFSNLLFYSIFCIVFTFGTVFVIGLERSEKQIILRKVFR